VLFYESLQMHCCLCCDVGTNLQSLLDHTQTPESSASVVLVISNIAGVAGLDRAKKCGVDTLVCPLSVAISGFWVSAAYRTVSIPTNITVLQVVECIFTVYWCVVVYGVLVVVVAVVVVLDESSLLDDCKLTKLLIVQSCYTAQ